MNNTEIFNINFSLQNKHLPLNVFALRILDLNKNKIYDIAIEHNGYCPEIYTEREQSNYNDYIANLEREVVYQFFKYNKIRIPKNYSNIFEVITNYKGELYHYSKVVN